MGDREEGTPTRLLTTESVLQDELQDLRLMAANADHLRWVTRGEGRDSFDDIVSRYGDEWREWAEKVAHCLVERDTAPDGRVSSLAARTSRGWLPGDWLDTTTASEWVVKELEILGSWAHTRSEQFEDVPVHELFVALEEVLARELDEFGRWFDGQLVDPVDEAGRESFPASDPPSSWAGGSRSG